MPIYNDNWLFLLKASVSNCFLSEQALFYVLRRCNLVENEENVNKLEEESTESTVTDDQTETTDQKEEKSPSDEPGAGDTFPVQQAETGGTTIDLEEILKELLKPKYTNEFIETDNFKLQVDHYMTTGDMLVSMLLAANIAVMLLCRLLRDRK